MVRVFIFSKHPLFGQGVESLLRQETELEIVGQETDADVAIGRITELRPDAVIVDSGDPACDPAAIVARVLRTGVTARIIGLNLEDNTLHLYRGEQRVVKGVEDLVKAVKENEPHAVEKAEKKVLERVSAEPAYRLVLYKILKFCETPRLAAEAEREIRSFPEMKTAIHSPIVLEGWLEEAGGIERVLVRKGEEHWQTTEAGKKVVEREAPRKRLLELISKEPVYSDIYVQVLRFCETPKTKTEIEELLQDNPVLESPKVYATFFIQGLEAAGGLEWDGKWRTTEAGKGVAG